MLKTLFTLTIILGSFSVWSQISGKIIDDSNGAPLAGVSILINENEIIISDKNGAFNLVGTSGEITVSHVGYETQTLSIDSKTEQVLISMAAGSFNLQEVVVSAYHSNRKLLDTPGPVALVSKSNIDRDQDLNLDLQQKSGHIVKRILNN